MGHLTNGRAIQTPRKEAERDKSVKLCDSAHQYTIIASVFRGKTRFGWQGARIIVLFPETALIPHYDYVLL